MGPPLKEWGHPSGRLGLAGNHTLVLQLPVQLKRCGIETKLVIPNGPPPAAHNRAVNALQDALRKALLWNQDLLEGKGPTLADIAKRESVNERYVGQLIRLAYLAPDIMDRIFAGDIPTLLSLEKIKRKGIPLDWQVQRQQYGFVD